MFIAHATPPPCFATARLDALSSPLCTPELSTEPSQLNATFPAYFWQTHTLRLMTAENRNKQSFVVMHFYSNRHTQAPEQTHGSEDTRQELSVTHTHTQETIHSTCQPFTRADQHPTQRAQVLWTHGPSGWVLCLLSRSGSCVSASLFQALGLFFMLAPLLSASSDRTCVLLPALECDEILTKP